MTIYLDNMAATPVDPRVADRHRDAALAYPANAHSAEHSSGEDANGEIERATATIAATLGLDDAPVTFTPGASAALWLAVEDAIARSAGRPARVAASSAEHPALLAALERARADNRIDVSFLPVANDGSLRLDAVEATLAGGVDLICAMAANNEVGTIADLAAVRSLAVRHGARLLVDGSQAVGRIDPSAFAGADLLVVSGAKMYGPRRVGGLIGRIAEVAADRGRELFGSPDAAGASALAYALQLREAERGADEPRIEAMRDGLERRLLDRVPGLHVNGARHARLAGSLHVSTPHLPGEAAVARLWGRVALSTGAACRSGVPGPSHVLAAMGVPRWVSEGAVRIGIGRFNTIDELEEAGAAVAVALVAQPMLRRA